MGKWLLGRSQRGCPGGWGMHLGFILGLSVCVCMCLPAGLGDGG